MRLPLGVVVYVGSMGLEVIMGPGKLKITQYPVHREMCKCTIIPSIPRPIEHRVTLNPTVYTSSGRELTLFESKGVENRMIVLQKVSRFEKTRSLLSTTGSKPNR